MKKEEILQKIKDYRNGIDVDRNFELILGFFSSSISKSAKKKMKKHLHHNNIGEEYRDCYNDTVIYFKKLLDKVDVNSNTALTYLANVRNYSFQTLNKHKAQKETINIDSDDLNTTVEDNVLEREIISSRFSGKHKILVEMLMDGENDYTIRQKLGIHWSELQKMKGEIAPIVMEICNEKKY